MSVFAKSLLLSALRTGDVSHPKVRLERFSGRCDDDYL